MDVQKTEFPGLIVINPEIFGDERGYFFESYNYKDFLKAGIDRIFIQDNQSKSSYGVLRGLHYQLEPDAQTKLVRVLEGTILDIVVDIRLGSPTHKKYFSIELSSKNQKILNIPKGFAHGFVVISDTALVTYKCDNYYHPESERGIHYADPELNIDWGIPATDFIVSDRDKEFPNCSKAEMNFTFK